MAATILFLVSAVRATAESFSVNAGQEEIRLLNLEDDDRVLVKFTVTGQTSLLDFCIVDPYGNVMEIFRNTGSVDYSFICSQEGEYKLVFSNIASEEDKLVSLDYEVEHYIFGVPQMLFLTFIVVGLCVAAVAVYIIMSRHP